MVIGAFPAAKLGYLFVRQLSKPIANYAKERAKSHPFFRKYVCMPPARFYNWCEIKAKMWILNLGKPVNVPQLNEAQAIELGANLFGEIIIYGIASALLLGEYYRTTAKAAQKEKDEEERMNNLKYTIQELCIQAEQQEAQIRELHRRVYDLDSKVVKKPWTLSGSDENKTDPQPQKSNGGQGVITQAITYIEKDVLNGDNSKKTQRSV